MVRGIPAPTIMWHRNGMEIQNGNLYNISTVENGFTVESVLVIESVSSSHEGNYSCTAANEFDNGTSYSFLSVLTGNSYNLIMFIIFPYFTIWFCCIEDVMIRKVTSNTTALVTSSVTLMCIASGIPLPTIAWYRNGSQLVPSLASFTINGTVVISELELTNPQLIDDGLYTCNASSSRGYDSREFKLTLQSECSSANLSFTYY